MTILFAPPALIFLNNQISDETKAIIQKQLNISETITGEEFDLRLATDPNYKSVIHGNNLRVLVMRSFAESANRELADLALFYKNGLICVEKSNFGPPGITFPINNLYLSELFFLNR